MASSAPSWPGVRPVKTCTECKQSKLRCDSKDMFPNPCSRCQARKLACTVDPSFRRTPARKRLEAMSRELRELRDQRVSNSRAGSTTSPDPESTRSQDSSCNTSQPSTAILLEDFELLGLETFELGGVTIDKQSIVEIFNLFTTVFHPHIPILGPISLKNIYHSHPFLFWTIIIIVALRSPLPTDEDLFTRLHEPYLRMLRTDILQAPTPLSKIQALLFLCVWPLPVMHQRDDPSWLYCGIAVNAALYMSLHRSSPKSGNTPSLYSVGVISGSTRERTNTWLGCFYVSTSLSMHLGLPPMINAPSDLASVRTILNEHSLPREFSLQIRVLLIMAGFSNVLAHNSNDGVVDSSVTQLLDGELDTLRITYPDGWTTMIDYSVMVVKMHVYTLIITRSRSGASSRDILLKLGLAASLRIIHLANLRFHERLDKAQTMTTIQRELTLPKDYYRGLAFATIFLLRYFGLNNENSNAEEQQLAANHVIMSHTIFKTLAKHPRDEYDRVSSLFETLCKQAPIPPDTGKPGVTGRMGVSILLDAITAAREIRGFPIEMPEPEALNTAESLPGPSNISHVDVFDANSQLVEPWQSDLAFANMFWGDPSWDVYNLSTDIPQYNPDQGL
ncbi:fungal-specific transcription factor domain-containing protein [Annulohypoxylon bovei var. microspora]|nr:fungal-specific transcription factor domain-containing protein [Annulohypoxylon bovei var. microspora]